jgi:hypothetical protein
MTTIHSYTATQKTVDGVSAKERAYVFFFFVADHQSFVAFYLEFANVIDVPQPSSVFALFFFGCLS